MSETLLSVRNLDVAYGDFLAIHDVSLDIKKGSVVSLIGANGAGKSTILKTIMGINKPKRGTIIFDGKDITGLKTSKIVAAGLTMSPEGSHTFEKMNVRDNLLMGAFLAKSGSERLERLEKIYKLFPVLKEKERQLASFLSGGQRQMLAVGRALMTQPKMLLCDEISLGLAPVVIKDIYAKLKEINDQGITILLVEQDVSRSLKHSDYAYVILEGRVVMQGKSNQLDQKEVNDAYFGMNKYA